MDWVQDVAVNLMDKKKPDPWGEFKEFVPKADLDKILSSVAQRLNGTCLGHDRAAQLKRVLATVIYNKKLNSEVLRRLSESKIGDADLPVYFKKEYMCLASAGGLKYRFLGKDRSAYDRFEDDQWLFLAPVFSDNESSEAYLELDAKCPLPVIWRDYPPLGGSTTAKVWKIQIHHSHLDLASSLTTEDTPFLALKEMNSDSKDDFLREDTALKRIRELNHPNFIRLIVSFKRGRTYFFLFPWADGGDLRSYWKDNNQKRTRQTMLWTLRQISGLAGALHRLHAPGNEDNPDENCRHGDLKPGNILLFKEGKGPGVLRIADAGLARIHLQVTKKRINGTTTTGGTEEYAPPESRRESLPDDQRSKAKLPRGYDIWSFGCILLEFLVWLLGGDSELVKFRDERKPSNKDEAARFFKIKVTSRNKEESYAVHSKVKSYIRSICYDSRCKDTWMSTLAVIIEGNLLRTEASQRITSERLNARLVKMLQEAENDERYLMGPSGTEGFQAMALKKHGVSSMMKNCVNRPSRPS
ncbi:kinase-like domain-containing protein [Xylariaceae sp. FL1272]|nr:kinase-like domain-containing protein [Xylariaceae sp. FL1272]